MAESKLELLGRRVEVMNARPGWDTEPPASGWLQRWAGGERRGRGGGGCNASCMHGAASAFVNAKASTDFRCTFSALVCFILDVKACIFVQC